MAATSSSPSAAAAQATATTEKEETADPNNYRTWVLKVSVHCEGCKKKVKKILNGIEGVHETEVDVKQQKVTVTGKVDAETLIRKLVKTGKKAELWPGKQPVNQREKKSSSKNNSNNKEKSNEDQKQNQINDVVEREKEKGKQHISKVEVFAQDQPISKVEVLAQDHSSNSSKIVDNVGDAGSSKTNVPVKSSQESKSEGKKPETGPVGNQSPASEKKTGEVDGAGEKSHGGKKKKKKGQNGNLAEDGGPSGDVQACTELPPKQTHGQAQGPLRPNQSPPRHPVHRYPPPHQYYSPPVFAMSYNMAQPTSYGASYYAAPSPPSYSYHAYSHHPGPEQPQPSDLDNYTSRPSDSFDLFSDENPNGCSIV